ncbi:hypothetical protein B0H15DRAFT_859876 [Mycena belliarum]|uniref:Uncharacterized protein n=1 Tax=Mycena belliarum TaxID=1033014 RepID=A0AAD6TYT9_9AGAR|nr:hypothetical protein B0H15DRAFT_859876 [Mycena belliae]
MSRTRLIKETIFQEIQQHPSPSTTMSDSYASVAKHNAPPLSEQPRPDPALYTTPADTAAPPAASTNKANTARNPRTSAPAGRPNRRLEETKAEGIYLWASAKHYLFRPGVAGGLIGLVNIGLMAGAARAFYVQPLYRRDTTIISSTVAAALAILSVEGYAAEAYRKTAAGQEEERRAKEEGAVLYRHAREQILRPGTLGGLVGIINLAILGTVGYFSYENWDRSWDRRVVSAVSAGLLTLSVGEGFLAEKYREQV